MTAAPQELAQHAVLAEEKSFEQFFRQYYRVLCLYATSLVESQDEAEEIVQHVFVHLWEKRRELEIEQSLKSYLYRAVYNRCMNAIKQRNVRVQYEQQPQEEGYYGHYKHEINELEKRLSEAIQLLPEQCRRVFQLSRFEHLKYAEIARVLGISVKAVEKHMGKALRILREQLSEFLPMWVFIFLGGW